jgi:hypothetical protein
MEEGGQEVRKGGREGRRYAGVGKGDRGKREGRKE